MAYTFLKSQGYEIGHLLEEDKIQLAKELIDSAKNKGVQLLLPSDIVVADEIKEGADHTTVRIEDIPKIKWV